ncbi:MAG: MFS transporter [candidate division WOR-3 bacterium]|nr:MAG: MFS transporter [candidate division WOR-3 bacterium]
MSTKPANKLKWLSSNILCLGLVSLFTDLSTEMAYPIIPVFLKEVLKVQPLFIGLIEAIAESTASILKTFSGYISDRLKKRKLFIFLGYSLSALAKPLLAFAAQGWHVLMVRFSDRVGKGIRTAPRDALIADSAKDAYFGRTYGFHRALDTLGAMLGPLTAFFVLALSQNNYRLLFGLAVVPGIIAIVIILLGVREIVPEVTRAFRFSFRQISPRLKLFLIIMIIFTLGNSSDAFLILRARNIGVSATMIPLLWLVFNISYFLWAYPAGMLSDRIGRRKTIFLGFMIFSLCYAAFSLNHSAIVIWFIFIIYGLYYGFTEGNLRAYVADLTTSDIRATVFGIYHTVVGITLLPANLLMGYLWQRFGFQTALLLGASLSLISGIALIASGKFLAGERVGLSSGAIS